MHREEGMRHPRHPRQNRHPLQSVSFSILAFLLDLVSGWLSSDFVLIDFVLIDFVLIDFVLFCSSSNVACRAARGTYNTDYAGVEDFMRHEKDVGSSEYQIARLSTRIKQLTEHLKEHKTDHATRRGLMSLLNKRNTLLKYLFNNDRKTYTATIESLGIRSRLADEL